MSLSFTAAERLGSSWFTPSRLVISTAFPTAMPPSRQHAVCFIHNQPWDIASLGALASEMDCGDALRLQQVENVSYVKLIYAFLMPSFPTFVGYALFQHICQLYVCFHFFQRHIQLQKHFRLLSKFKVPNCKALWGRWALHRNDWQIDQLTSNELTE